MFQIHSILLITLIAASAIQALQVDKSVADARDACMAENGLTPASFAGSSQPGPMEVPEKNLCFIKCMHEKMKVVDGSGKIMVDAFNNSPILNGLAPEQKQKVVDCASKLPALPTCADQIKFADCFMGISMKDVIGL